MKGWIKLKNNKMLKEIHEIIKEETGIDFIEDNSRKREVIDVRQIFCKIAIDHYDIYQIAEFINRDRTSVIHSIARVKEVAEFDKEFRTKYIDCQQSVIEKLNPERRKRTTKDQIKEVQFLKKLINQIENER